MESACICLPLLKTGHSHSMQRTSRDVEKVLYLSSTEGFLTDKVCQFDRLDSTARVRV